ncbi:hypothetical protein [Curtobacterium sp. MCPF17_052]|uniref:hypothetical protein n=1 Tax=Curtobacterium sp. MCPF17_052 TaxID=2175655 RepID=UPI0024E030F2|nr:hypothetical protein [Curtobacterium sp. MCPF17_052]WIB11887.1 hypothetical protein DEJ36_13545 [Curtobacterium sp. MCPF17_052]
MAERKRLTPRPPPTPLVSTAAPPTRSQDRANASTSRSRSAPDTVNGTRRDRSYPPSGPNTPPEASTTPLRPRGEHERTRHRPSEPDPQRQPARR